MDPYRGEESTIEKISSSVKKSHKISIYSRKTNKSPKKQHDSDKEYIKSNTQQSIKDLGGIAFNNANNQQSYQLNSAKINYQNNNNYTEQTQQHRSLSGYFNGIIQSPQTTDNKQNSIIKHQLSYQQRFNDNNFFNQTAEITKKLNSFNTTGNVNNISQMIDKQVQSETNNLSMLQGSFMTGNRGKSNKQSFINNNIILNSNMNSSGQLQQQQTIQHFMKFIHEQISIVKQNYEQKFTLVLKNNMHTIKQLQSRLYQNYAILKQKNEQIQKLKQVIRKIVINNSNEKKIHSQGEIGNKDQRTISITQDKSNKNNNQTVNAMNNANGYYEKRVTDLQAKIRILQQLLPKSQQTQKIYTKIQLLQKGLLQYLSSQVSQLSTNLQSFVHTSSTKLSTLYQSIQSLTVSLSNFQQESTKIGFNQNRIKQVSQKMKQIDKELHQFLLKSFQYQNYGINELKQQMTAMKQRLIQIENYKSENSKIVSQLVEQNKLYRRGMSSQRQDCKIKLSNAYETMSKYSQSIMNNMSKNSISQLSNTNQYSHMIQKMNLRHNNANNNNNGTSSQSFIQLNFTLQEGEQSIGTNGEIIEDKEKYHSKIEKDQSGIIASKYTMRKVANPDIIKSQTNNNVINTINNNSNTLSQQQQSINVKTVSPSIISKLSLPNTRPSISIQSILSPHLSSTQQKIKNLSQLKMESKQRLSSISSLSQQHFQPQQTPRSPLQKLQYYDNNTKKQHNEKQRRQSSDNNNHSNSYIENNTSYLSIGQLQDYHQSLQYQHLLQLQGNNNTSCDWSDDQFFYPQLMQKHYQQQSNVRNYCWQQNQYIDSRSNLQSPQQKLTYPLIKENDTKNKSNKINKFITQNQQFSPMKKKLISTQTNFYQSMKYTHQSQQSSPSTYQKLTKTKSNQQKQPPKQLIYSQSFDYQKFSDSQEEKQFHNKESPLKNGKNAINHRLPLNLYINPLSLNLNKIPQNLAKKLQKPPLSPQPFTINEQKLIEKCKLLQKSQLPIKLIYDRKKCEAIAKMPNSNHQLNGKTFILERKQLQKLQTLGFIQVKTYI